ncbi:hypothetical protein AUEXF2481DRAFT_101082 [Aureobasidium subglaciale EXF-2481]|uniref:FAD-binding domain-containing protein n=1 Tax=Aureobasidium subglaciale (strain EXF-2481) TaxID=1043005 RepID=A0A074YZ27_AURSE|nr:uncharacterized protein AUEXF2481DRAFT_101082 [Aureobasidium subglaciale EXF-2481]KEQ92081.1 hypothetical protein AUEXF2481DRAFT_101082 [Aureobasidium subglaciale EXF-2481]
MHNSTSIPSYPTRCTTFLDDLAKDIHDSRHLNGNTNGSRANEPGVIPPRALVPLDIIIVGAGLGGLATSIALSRRGHKVRVLEQATALGEVGAGIQIPSNSSRILLDWGLGSFLKGKVVEPENITFRRWEDGSAVGFTKLIPEFQKSFDAPYYVVHRADFHDAMHKLALELGVEVLVSSRVVRYNSEDAAVETANGRKYSGDLVIAADGVKSLARAVIIGTTASPPVPTGFAAYRATVDVEKMKEDPEIAWLLETSALNVWIGEDRHVMTYTIAGGRSFNMVLSHIDHTDMVTWRQENVVQDIRDSFAGWDPCLMKIIHLIDKGLKWPLLSGEVLNRWLDPSGKLLLIGDAAHAMVPYMSQGAAMAVEDGAALGEILSIVEHKSQIHSALSVFERVRMQRTSQMQEASLLNGKIWHFADGPEQRARDASMRAEVEGKQFISSPNQWSDPVTQWWAYGYRAADEVVKAWKESLSAKNL